MILLNKRPFSVLLFLHLWSLSLCAQNLFDARHTETYAAHLFAKKQFGASAIEYKRLLGFYPSSDTLIRQVMITYRLAGLPDSALSIVKSRIQYHSYIPDIILEEIEKDFILTKSYSIADNFISKQADSIKFLKYIFYARTLSGNWLSARCMYYNDSMNLKNKREWKDVLARQEHLRYKSPELAMALSTLIPGSGKIYSGDWKDGLFAMLMIGSMTYESYVGFHARGTRSVLGWVFAGLTIGFYGGNIYGSYHSAQRYNARLNLKIHDETEKLVVSDF